MQTRGSSAETKQIRYKLRELIGKPKKGLERETARRKETTLLELFDFTRHKRDRLNLAAEALARHAHRELVLYSDFENSEGSGEEDEADTVSHTSGDHTSSQGEGNSQISDISHTNPNIDEAEFKRMARLDAAKRVYKSMHPGDFPKDEQV